MDIFVFSFQNSTASLQSSKTTGERGNAWRENNVISPLLGCENELQRFSTQSLSSFCEGILGSVCDSWMPLL